MRAALTERLLDDAPLQSLVGGRVHWNRLPTDQRVRPFITLQKVAGVPIYTIARGGSLTDGAFQVDIWADDVATGVAIVARCRALLSGWRGAGAGDVFVCGAVITAERDLDSDTAGDVQELHGVALEVSAIWRE